MCSEKKRKKNFETKIIKLHIKKNKLFLFFFFLENNLKLLTVPQNQLFWWHMLLYF